MALIERIQKDLTEAMKLKDELRLSVLRMVKSALKNKEVEKIRALEDTEAIQVLQTLVQLFAQSGIASPRFRRYNRGAMTCAASADVRTATISNSTRSFQALVHTAKSDGSSVRIS